MHLEILRPAGVIVGVYAVVGPFAHQAAGPSQVRNATTEVVQAADYIGDSNVYAYVGGSPIRYVDPFGLDLSGGGGGGDPFATDQGDGVKGPSAGAGGYAPGCDGYCGGLGGDSQGDGFGIRQVSAGVAGGGPAGLSGGNGDGSSVADFGTSVPPDFGPGEQPFGIETSVDRSRPFTGDLGLAASVAGQNLMIDAASAFAGPTGPALSAVGLSPDSLRQSLPQSNSAAGRDTQMAYEVIQTGGVVLSVILGSGGGAARVAASAEAGPLVRGTENIRFFGSLVEARGAARQMAGLGEDAVKYASEVGPVKGQVVGSASADGLRGWRIDFDLTKGYHVNWWNKTGGSARSTWTYGANIIDGGTEGDFLNFLQHLQ